MNFTMLTFDTRKASARALTEVTCGFDCQKSRFRVVWTVQAERRTAAAAVISPQKNGFMAKLKLVLIFKLVLILGGLLAIALAVTSGRFLVVNQPRKSDVLVVLAGETDRRPARGLELLDQGYAPRLILDVPAQAKIYQWNQLEIARKFVEELPQASAISICPIYGLSTRDEAQDVARCLQGTDARRILLVTSDYHTRRALSIFEKALPADYSIAAAFDASEFGAQWWRHREWAKVNLEEWLKLIWWEVVDRWR